MLAAGCSLSQSGCNGCPSRPPWPPGRLWPPWPPLAAPGRPGRPWPPSPHLAALVSPDEAEYGHRQEATAGAVARHGGRALPREHARRIRPVSQGGGKEEKGIKKFNQFLVKQSKDVFTLIR